MAEAKTTDEAEPTPAVATDEAAPAAPKRSKLKVFAIGGAALTLCLGGGGYFALPIALAMFAPAAEASTQEASAAAEGHGGAPAVPAAPMPVARLVTPDRAASDYQIVSVYDGEAFLATRDTVIRVEVGSTAPGLGDILAIEPSESGGTVKGTLATLKTS